MPINYSEFNEVADFYAENVYPYLHQRCTVLMSSVNDYLERIGQNPKYYNSFPSLYCYKIKDFLQKYEQNCISFCSSLEPNITGKFRILYQISPTFHVDVGTFVWIESAKLYSHLQVNTTYKDFNEYRKFIEENKDLHMTEEIKPFTGFGVVKY